MFKVWAIQNKELKRDDYSLWHFAQDFIQGKYADPESIRRNRQILQSRHIGLQGTIYKYRQKASIETQQQIKMI